MSLKSNPIRIETASNLKGDIGIDSSILNLLQSELSIVPPAPCDPPRLLNVLTEDSLRQGFKSSPHHLGLTQHVGSDGAKVDGVGDTDGVVLAKLVDVALDPDADEGVGCVGEEGGE